MILSALEAASEAKFQVKSQQYESTLHTQNEQLNRQENELNLYRAQLEALQIAFDGQHSALQQAQSVLTDARDDNQSLRESLAKEVGRRETLEVAIADRDRQLMALQKELKTLLSRNEILTESHAGKTAELQQLQLREREQRATAKERSDEIKQLKEVLKSGQQLRDKEMNRLALSVDQLVRSQPRPAASATKKTGA